jgi:hypothetical protein
VSSDGPCMGRTSPCREQALCRASNVKDRQASPDRPIGRIISHPCVKRPRADAKRPRGTGRLCDSSTSTSGVSSSRRDTCWDGYGWCCAWAKWPEGRDAVAALLHRRGRRHCRAYVVVRVLGHTRTIEECGDRDPSGARVGAILQALIAREPVEHRPTIRAWLPAGFVPPQVTIMSAKPRRGVNGAVARSGRSDRRRRRLGYLPTRCFAGVAISSEWSILNGCRGANSG